MTSEMMTSYVRIRRIDEERHIVYGVVYSPNEIDTWGECMLPEDVETMAHRFMQLPTVRASIDTAHDEKSNGSYPIESFIARKGDQDYPEGSWVLGVKIPDEAVWKRIKSGDLNGYSFQAMVQKVPAVVELEISVDNFGRTEEVDGHTHLFWAEIDDDGVVRSGRTSTVNGHSHEIFGGTATDMSCGHAHRFFF